MILILCQYCFTTHQHSDIECTDIHYGVKREEWYTSDTWEMWCNVTVIHTALLHSPHGDEIFSSRNFRPLTLTIPWTRNWRKMGLLRLQYSNMFTLIWIKTSDLVPLRLIQNTGFCKANTDRVHFLHSFSKKFELIICVNWTYCGVNTVCPSVVEQCEVER